MQKVENSDITKRGNALNPCPACGGKGYNPRLTAIGAGHCTIRIGCTACLFAISRIIYSLDVDEISKESERLVEKWNGV